METEVKEIMKMYNRVKSPVRLEDGRSKWFNVNVGIHYKSVLSSLLFVVVLDEITKDVREGILIDLVLLGDRWSKVEEKYGKWKKTLNNKGLKINVSKTKAFHSVQKTPSVAKIDLCAVFHKKIELQLY